MKNRIAAGCWITTLAILLVGLDCRFAMADPVDIDSLHLSPQSSLPPDLAQYGNRIGTPYHETSLKRADVKGFPPWPAPGGDLLWDDPFGGLLRMYSSLDALGESWAIAAKGDRFPGGGGVGIPYAPLGPPPPPPVVIPSEVFYVAFVWDYNFVEPSGNEVFGWAKLQVAPSLPPSPSNPFGYANPDLILLASATTTDDRGIIVGEYRVVPEPASLACASAGLLGLLLARRGLSTRRTKPPSPSSRRQ